MLTASVQEMALSLGDWTEGTIIVGAHTLKSLTKLSDQGAEPWVAGLIWRSNSPSETLLFCSKLAGVLRLALD